jgi:hypothetical protein
MKDIEKGSIVLMIKNEDGTFSPVGVSKVHIEVLNHFIGKLSEEIPLIKAKEKYVQTS